MSDNPSDSWLGASDDLTGQLPLDATDGQRLVHMAAGKPLEHTGVESSTHNQLNNHDFEVAVQDLLGRGISMRGIEQIVTGHKFPADKLAWAMARKETLLANKNWVERWQAGDRVCMHDITEVNGIISNNREP